MASKWSDLLTAASEQNETVCAFRRITVVSFHCFFVFSTASTKLSLTTGWVMTSRQSDRWFNPSPLTIPTCQDQTSDGLWVDPKTDTLLKTIMLTIAPTLSDSFSITHCDFHCQITVPSFSTCRFALRKHLHMYCRCLKVSIKGHWLLLKCTDSDSIWWIAVVLG